jgi:hypothetical protein
MSIATQSSYDYFPDLAYLRYPVAAILDRSPHLKTQAQRVRGCHHPLSDGFDRYSEYCHQRVCPPCARDTARHYRDKLLDGLSSAQSKINQKISYYLGTFTIQDVPVGELRAATRTLRAGVRHLMQDARTYPGWSMAIETPYSGSDSTEYNAHVHCAFLTSGHGGRSYRSEKKWNEEWQKVVPTARSVRIKHSTTGDEEAFLSLSNYTVMTGTKDWFDAFDLELKDPDRFLQTYE